jgi:sialate O-acetylesterase
MKIKGKTAMLSFDHAKSGLTSYDRSILGLEVAGANKKFYPAEGKISRGLLEVSSDNVKIPVAVRYAFENCIEGRLFNTAGLPAPSFRTDNW